MTTAVYRTYDRSGALLYVGVARRVGVRLHQHDERSEWFADVAFLDVSWYATRDAALLAEAQAIATEGPIYNVRGTRGAPPSPRGSETADRDRQRQDAIQQSLEKARSTVGALFAEVHLYCDNSACVVREFSLYIKEHDQVLSPVLRCPSCGQQGIRDWFGCVRREIAQEGVQTIGQFLAEGDPYEVLG
jgi:hypothetical protein